jgi:hypothetical protein
MLPLIGESRCDNRKNWRVRKMKYRRPSRKVTLLWAFMVFMVIAGLIIGFTVSTIAGTVLVVIGCAGYLIGGIVIYAIIPRR